jgi:hypothetical protein
MSKINRIFCTNPPIIWGCPMGDGASMGSAGELKSYSFRMNFFRNKKFIKDK